MRRQIITLVSGLVLALNICGCASQPVFYDQEVTTPVVVDSSKSYVYFYRPCVVRSTSKIVVISDKVRKIGAVNCGTYIVYETDPGKHTFNANDWLGQDHPLKMELEVGRKYFIEIDLRLSVLDSLSPLKLMDDITDNDLTELKHVTGK